MSSGYLVQAGITTGITWAAAAAASTIPIPIVSESITKAFDLQRSKALHAQAAAHEPTFGHDMVTGSLGVDFDYDASHLVGAAMGGVSGTTYTFTDDLPDCIRLEIDKDVERYRYGSAKINQMTITGEAGSEDPIQASYDLILHSESRTPSAYGAGSLTPDPVFFSDLQYFRVADQADGIAAGDEIYIKSFEITVENSLEGGSKDSGSLHVVEPIRSDFRTVTLKVGFARYNTTGVSNLDLWRDAETRLQADMVFAGANGGSCVIQFPEIKIVEGDTWNVSGPGIIEGEVTFEAFVNNHNSSMSGVSDQMQIIFT